MANVHLVLDLLALICFVAAAANVTSSINLLATGLALLTLTLLI